MAVKPKAFPLLAIVLSWRSCSPFAVPAGGRRGPATAATAVGLAPQHRGRSVAAATATNGLRASSLSSSSPTASSASSTDVGPRMPIDESYPGLKLVHADPDVYVVEHFLDASSCDDLIEAASKRDMDQSPVAYAGWTSDLKDLLELAAKGPVSWLALAGAWYQTNESGGGNVALVVHVLQNFAGLFALAAVGIAAFTKSRESGLQALRTSTSTTIDDLSERDEDGGGGNGAATFVRNTAQLFTEVDTKKKRGALKREAALFEAPTVIRYEAGQVLAPHYDANRSAQTEDANRGGQTLATLLVYLNDVGEGGLTRFGKLPPSPNAGGDEGETALTVRPRRGDALLFFPADASGQFDERAEHEGCPAVDEKWIARIWRHEGRVPPPFGLSDRELDRI